MLLFVADNVHRASPSDSKHSSGLRRNNSLLAIVRFCIWTSRFVSKDTSMRQERGRFVRSQNLKRTSCTTGPRRVRNPAQSSKPVVISLFCTTFREPFRVVRFQRRVCGVTTPLKWRYELPSTNASKPSNEERDTSKACLVVSHNLR